MPTTLRLCSHKGHGANMLWSSSSTVYALDKIRAGSALQALVSVVQDFHPNFGTEGEATPAWLTLSLQQQVRSYSWCLRVLKMFEKKKCAGGFHLHSTPYPDSATYFGGAPQFRR